MRTPCAPSLHALIALTFVASPAPAQSPPHELGPPTLTVDGQGEVAVKPDRAVVFLGATAQAANATDAQSQVNATMRAAIQAIRDTGVPEQLMRTSGLSLDPVYSEAARQGPGDPAEHWPKIVAYRANNTIQVRVDDLASVGEVIDAGINAGANQLQGISFELRDDTAQRAEALRRAVQSAQAKAEALAEAADVQLSMVQRMHAGSAGPIMPQYTGRMMAMEAATPVEPGQISVHASVTMTWRIARREAKEQDR
jgi:uncharacterized protein YggE